MRTILFEDREAAGALLAERLAGCALQRPLVLALPRGGLPVALPVARRLGARLDLLFVRKIGAPGHEELAAAALVDGADPQLVLNESVVRELAIPERYIEAARSQALAEIARRRALYGRGRPPEVVEGRSIILVDDGIATGTTVKAALQALGRRRPDRLVLAVPVAPAETLAELRPLVDEAVCLATPEPFWSVGSHYRRFDQLSDAEVAALLAEVDRLAAG